MFWRKELFFEVDGPDRSLVESRNAPGVPGAA